MSLDQLDVVDTISISKADNAAVLHMLDSWDWSDEGAHLLALQEKFNAYLGFIESGQIFEDYPKARNRRLRIEIAHRFPLPSVAARLIEIARTVGAQLDVEVTHVHWPGRHAP